LLKPNRLSGVNYIDVRLDSCRLRRWRLRWWGLWRW
jgi:hypothetical protein